MTDEERKYLYAVMDENEKMAKKLRELRENLRTIEWCGVSGNDICIVCDGDRKHSEYCWIGNAVKDGMK